MSVDILYYTGQGVDYTSRWLARGFMTAAVIYAFSGISGAHANPAVTLGFTLRGVFSPAMMLWYWLAQFAGSFAAALLLELLFGRSLIYFGASHPGPQYGHVVAATCEAVLTFALMLMILLLAPKGGRRQAVCARRRLSGSRERIHCGADQRSIDESVAIDCSATAIGRVRPCLDLCNWTGCGRGNRRRRTRDVNR